MSGGVDVRMTCYRTEFDGGLQIAPEIAEFRWLDKRSRAQFSAVERQGLDQRADKTSLTDDDDLVQPVGAMAALPMHVAKPQRAESKKTSPPSTAR